MYKVKLSYKNKSGRVCVKLLSSAVTPPPQHPHADTHVRIRYNKNLDKNVRSPHTQAHPEELGPQFFGTVQLAPEKQALHTHWPLEHLQFERDVSTPFRSSHKGNAGMHTRERSAR